LGKNNQKAYIANVYSPCDLKDKMNLWQELISLRRAYYNKTSCVMSDFNIVRKQEEGKCINRTLVYKTEIDYFNLFSKEMDLFYIPMIEKIFT